MSLFQPCASVYQSCQEQEAHKWQVLASTVTARNEFLLLLISSTHWLKPALCDSVLVPPHV